MYFQLAGGAEDVFPTVGDRMFQALHTSYKKADIRVKNLCVLCGLKRTFRPAPVVV